MKLYFSTLKKLTLIFVTKKSYEICLPLHPILVSLINFEYIIPLTLVYTPPLCEISLPPYLLYLSHNVAQHPKSWRDCRFFTGFWIQKCKKGYVIQIIKLVLTLFQAGVFELFKGRGRGRGVFWLTILKSLLFTLKSWNLVQLIFELCFLFYDCLFVKNWWRQNFFDYVINVMKVLKPENIVPSSWVHS